ncbi:c-type cytochrome [Sphingobacterium spiritivorum]|uniref:c-type cytochrome n=1 Tax=Sphingobacterium spiritivorum TaxID=258 RepID=UPI003DA26E71
MEEELRKSGRIIRYVIALSIILVCFIVVSLYFTIHPPLSQAMATEQPDSILTHVDQYEGISFGDNTEGKLAAEGEKLIKETYNYFYKDGQKIGNRLACTNCHLNGGTKAFAAPYIGLSGVFPMYIGREDKIESLEERINGCFERSMNGQAIDVNSTEMRAIVTYIKQISAKAPIGKRIAGQGFVKVVVPERAANPKTGAVIFQKQCQSCHGNTGQGVKLANNKGYQYPPLWGEDSYNDGAGMARLLTAAKFIKANMPLGATYEAPVLSDEEAYDVAAYINSFPRPVKANKEKDYPNLEKKPKDSPYPPFNDQISQLQHKYGPYNF